VTPNLSTTYTLTATNGGGSVTARATVTVTSASGSKLQAGPGQTVTLPSNLILSGADTVDLIGSAANPCILQGNGHSILATDHTWNGHLTIQYCTVSNLGTITNDAFNLSAVDNGAITIENSTWDLSSSLVLEVAGNASVSFRYNLIPDTSLFPVSNGEPGQPYTRYCLQGKGTSTGSKVIAGNRIYKTFIDTLAATGWLIGGDTDADSNIVIGKRGGFYVGSGNVLRHNYSQALMPVDPVGWAWAQVTNLNTLGSGSLAEDNIINTAHWVARGIDGEMRNNVILGVELHMVQGGVGSIHHNIIAGGEPFPGLYNDPTTAYRCTSFIDNLRSSSLTVYNNTMDFRRTTGPCAAVTVDTNSFLPSLRSNVFFDLKLLSQWSAVDQGWGTAEFPRVTPYPARLGYTDYNAFYYDPNANVVNENQNIDSN